MSISSGPNLFTPLDLGHITLKHRVVMAPLTRSRSQQPGDVPGPLMLEYYGQRASDGGLIISEATSISVASKGWFGAPGMYSQAQVEGWSRIVDTVHARGGFMFSQLWHTGRSSHVGVTGGPVPGSASVDAEYWRDKSHLVSTPTGWTQPSPHRALSLDDIAHIVEDYRAAAANALHAGFDGVELHAANGYLIDQFLQDGSNHRDGRYGGTPENRMRLLLEVVDALTSIWGRGRVAVRIGPGGTWNGMSDSDPFGLFDEVAGALNRFDLAWLNVIEPRIKGNTLVGEDSGPIASERLRPIFTGRIIAAGGFEPDTAAVIVAKGNADAVAFGRHFISNPDLPERIRSGAALAPYDRSTFYTFEAVGYTDYPRLQPIAVGA